MSFSSRQNKYSLLDDDYLRSIDRIELLGYNEFCDLLREKFGEDYIPQFMQYPGQEERERLKCIVQNVSPDYIL